MARSGVYRGVMTERAEGTLPWMIVFLAISLLMILAGIGWLAFGPPIT